MRPRPLLFSPCVLPLVFALLLSVRAGPVAPRQDPSIDPAQGQAQGQDQQQGQQPGQGAAAGAGSASDTASDGFPPSDAQQAPILAALSNAQNELAAELADALPGVKSTKNGNLAYVPGQIVPDDGQQYWWNANLPNPADIPVSGSQDDGWQSLPQIDGFTLNTSLPVWNRHHNESGIMPFYQSYRDPALVKRFVVVLPGKPRDIWKYANFMSSARTIVTTQNFAPFNSWGITNDTVGIVAPAFLNLEDLNAGACQSTWLCFKQSYWQMGGLAHNPSMKTKISAYEALDAILDALFDKTTFPALNQVVVAGHSLGAQGAQRYALLKKTRYYDSNVRYWIGNPGSWAWLSANRPYTNASTQNEYDTWPYGLHGNTSKLPVYARRDAMHDDGLQVVERYRNRTVGYALGLFDIGRGSTSGQAQWQGSNHLDRGANFAMALANDFGGAWPATHTTDFLPNTTHLDFAMYTANISLQRLFYDGFDDLNPWLTNTTNPGDRPPRTPHGGSAGNNASGAPGNGTRSFATPTHITMARSLLGGSVASVILCYLLLPMFFRPNYDPAWEAVLPPPTKSGAS